MVSDSIKMYNESSELEFVLVTISDQSSDKELEKKYYSINEIIRITGFSRSTINRALKQGKLISKKIGSRRIISKENFEEYMKGDE